MEIFETISPVVEATFGEILLLFTGMIIETITKFTTAGQGVF